VASRAEENIAIQVGRALAQARLDDGRTQEEVAELLEIDKQSISRIETGKAWPTLARLVALTSLYGVDISSVFRSGSADSGHVAADLIEQLERLNAEDRVWVRRWLKQLCDRLAMEPATGQHRKRSRR
jgi:transcriptional regulator with XRE-family HTH domain